MQYTIHINQVRALEWGLNAQQAMLFAFLYQVPAWADSVEVDGNLYHFIDKAKVVKELPLLTDKADTVYRLMRSLKALGVIRLKAVDNRTCISITAKGTAWNNTSEQSETDTRPVQKVGKKSPAKSVGSEKNPTPGKSSDGRTQIRQGSEKNPSRVGKLSEPGSEKNPTNHITSNHITRSDDQYPVNDEREQLVDLPEADLAVSEIDDPTPNHDPFAMHLYWQPGPSFQDRCALSGIILNSITDKKRQEVFGEFLSYWTTRLEDENTQSQWEHKLLQNFINKNNRGELNKPAANDTTRGRSLAEDLTDKSWALGS